MPMPRHVRPLLTANARALLAVVIAILLAGCTAPGAAISEPDRPATPAHEATFPLALDNCGFPVTVENPPERVVTIKSSTLDMMLALGLADRVVGAAFLDGPVPAEYAGAGNKLQILSDGAPGMEAVLASEPDLVYAGWESNLAADSAGERSTLADLGVLTYVSPAACKGTDYKPDPLTFDDVFAEIAEAGSIFGVPDQAEALIEQQSAELAAVPADTTGVSALWYSSGSDTPYVGAGIGAPQMIMDAVGLINIAQDVHDTWTAFSWEQIVAEDPDVIVLVDAAWNTAESKIGLLEANPATAELTAVREQRYLTIPFPSTEAGVRNVAAAHDLADQLADLGLGR